MGRDTLLEKRFSQGGFVTMSLVVAPREIVVESRLRGGSALAAVGAREHARSTPHGARAATHDALTRIKGSFEKTMQGLRNMRDLGITVQLKCPITKLNNRLRGSLLAIDHLLAPRQLSKLRVYATEQVTAFFAWLRRVLEPQLKLA